MNKDINKEHNKTDRNDEHTGKGLEDCTSVMNPEMARNYEENEPCNDGTKTKREKK